MRFKFKLLGAALRSWLTRSWPDLGAISALLTLFLFVHRIVDGVDIGGDAVGKWQFVRQWAYANDFRHAEWDHHMTRMGVNAVAWVVQRVFGSEWSSYYIAPMAALALQLVLSYAISRRLAGRLAGLLAALAIIYLPAVETSVSQLLPDQFVGTYALIATYALIRWVEAEGRRRALWFGAACAAAFVGYLAKETFFFFYPGLFLAIWLATRRFRDVALLGGFLLLGLGLETLCYRALTLYRSRLHIVRSVHFAGGGDDEPSRVTVGGLFTQFERLDNAWLLLLLFASLGWLWLLVRNRSGRTEGRIVTVVGISHILLLGISSQTWQRPLPRYMDPAVPFAAIAAGVACAVAAKHALSWLQKVPSVAARFQRLMSSAPPHGSAVAVIIVAFAGVAWTYVDQHENPSFDGFAHGERMAALANDTYRRNLPLMQPARGKVLAAFYNVYLDDAALARGSVLPSFAQAVKREGRAAYLVKDPAAYRRGTFDALREADCVLVVKRGSKRRGMKGCADVARRSVLPARCDRLLAELTRAAP